MKKVYFKDVQEPVFYLNRRKNSSPYMRSMHEFKNSSFVLIKRIDRVNEYKIMHPYQEVYIIEPLDL